MRLHLSALPEPDAHVFDTRGECALHSTCVVSLQGLAPTAAVRFVLTGEEGTVHTISLDTSLLPTVSTDDEPTELAGIVGDEVTGFLSRLIAQLASTPPHIAAVTSPTTARALHSVLSAVTLEQAARASVRLPRSPADQVYERALRSIRMRLSDSSLAPADIAADCAITPRYLHMLFERRGETVSGRILSERLERCRSDLASPDDLAAGVTISQVAARWGFSTPSHFSQRFKAAYGLSPREWRAQALSAG